MACIKWSNSDSRKLIRTRQSGSKGESLRNKCVFSSLWLSRCSAVVTFDLQEAYYMNASSLSPFNKGSVGWRVGRQRCTICHLATGHSSRPPRAASAWLCSHSVHKQKWKSGYPSVDFKSPAAWRLSGGRGIRTDMPAVTDTQSETDFIVQVFDTIKTCMREHLQSFSLTNMSWHHCSRVFNSLKSADPHFPYLISCGMALQLKVIIGVPLDC